MNELDTGYSVKIGNPLINAEKKATGSSVSLPCEVIADGSYLVSLEVNGTVIAHRESLEFSSGSCTVGDYTLSYESYALTVSGVSNNDIVRVMVEPLEVKTTDAFRAAVKKDAPETPNELPAVAAADKDKFLHTNGSTGAVEWSNVPNELPAVAAADKGKFLHTNESTGALEWAEGGSGGGVLVAHDVNGTLDKTWQEIHDAMLAGGAVLKLTQQDRVEAVIRASYDSKAGQYEVVGYSGAAKVYVTSTASGYPSMTPA